MAGLFAAVKANGSGANLLLVSRGALGASGQTPFAKGIFCFDAEKEGMTLDEYVDKVSHSALSTKNAIFTRRSRSGIGFGRHAGQLGNRQRTRRWDR